MEILREFIVDLLLLDLHKSSRLQLRELNFIKRKSLQSVLLKKYFDHTYKSYMQNCVENNQDHYI